MKDVIESRVKSGLRRFGIDISYVKDAKYNPQMYINVLRGSISVKKPLNIIQVGANDGKHNDLIYNFVKENKQSSNIILIEPIKTVIPYLEKNYSFHPSSEIINKAIANQDTRCITLHGIEKNYWDDIDVSYGEDWPDYRIPTGVVTTDRDRLLQWVSKNINTDDSPEEIIKEFNVDVVQPNSIIDQSRVVNDVQLLQVDTEGMDDKIVYSFLDQGILPNLINIERKYLGEKREQIYDQKLQNKGYTIYNYTPTEKLAMK